MLRAKLLETLGIRCVFPANDGESDFTLGNSSARCMLEFTDERKGAPSSAFLDDMSEDVMAKILPKSYAEESEQVSKGKGRGFYFTSL